MSWSSNCNHWNTNIIKTVYIIYIFISFKFFVSYNIFTFPTNICYHFCDYISAKYSFIRIFIKYLFRPFTC